MNNELPNYLARPFKNVWEWNVFGNNPVLLRVITDFEVPLWRRIITKIILGSKWKRL